MTCRIHVSLDPSSLYVVADTRVRSSPRSVPIRHSRPYAASLPAQETARSARHTFLGRYARFFLFTKNLVEHLAGQSFSDMISSPPPYPAPLDTTTCTPHETRNVPPLTSDYMSITDLLKPLLANRPTHPPLILKHKERHPLHPHAPRSRIPLLRLSIHLLPLQKRHGGRLGGKDGMFHGQRGERGQVRGRDAPAVVRKHEVLG